MCRFGIPVWFVVIVYLACAVFGGQPALAADDPVVRNVTSGQHFSTLGAALVSARDGDRPEIEGGPHVGNFVIDRRLTLIGVSAADTPPVLDGGGTGSVLRITAPDVTIENVALTHSGTGSSPFWHWGDAGVRVEADSTNLRKLHVYDNDWGILMFGGRGSDVEGSLIEDNRREGIKVMGGREHRLAGNTVLRNSNGILLDVLHLTQESPLVNMRDPHAVAQMQTERDQALRSEDVVITGNHVRGNASFGIAVTWHSRRITVENNDVHLTGIERKPDQEAITAVERTVTAGLGGQSTATVNRSSLGSGIQLLCLVEDSRVIGNDSHDNLGAGVGLSLVNRNQIDGNLTRANRIGIAVVSSNDNVIERNQVTANSEYGIRIGSTSALSAAAANNLVALNDLTGNKVNAYDSSGRKPTIDDLAGVIDTMPYPDVVKEQLRRNPAMRESMLRGYLGQFKPASNRWDNGSHGNRHDDFDEAPEGFVDRNEDGISEVAKPIPGGTSVDHYPVTEALITTLSTAR